MLLVSLAKIPHWYLCCFPILHYVCRYIVIIESSNISLTYFELLYSYVIKCLHILCIYTIIIKKNDYTKYYVSSSSIIFISVFAIRRQHLANASKINVYIIYTGWPIENSPARFTALYVKIKKKTSDP